MLVPSVVHGLRTDTHIVVCVPTIISTPTTNTLIAERHTKYVMSSWALRYFLYYFEVTYSCVKCSSNVRKYFELFLDSFPIHSEMGVTSMLSNTCCIIMSYVMIMTNVRNFHKMILLSSWMVKEHLKESKVTPDVMKLYPTRTCLDFTHIQP